MDATTYIHFSHNFNQKCSIMDSLFECKHTAFREWRGSNTQTHTNTLSIVYLRTIENSVKIITTENFSTVFFFYVSASLSIRGYISFALWVCQCFSWSKKDLRKNSKLNGYDNKRHCWHHIYIERAQSVRISMRSGNDKGRRRKKRSAAFFLETTCFHVPT